MGYMRVELGARNCVDLSAWAVSDRAHSFGTDLARLRSLLFLVKKLLLSPLTSLLVAVSAGVVEFSENADSCGMVDAELPYPARVSNNADAKRC